MLGHGFGLPLALSAAVIALFANRSVNFWPNFDNFLKSFVSGGISGHVFHHFLTILSRPTLRVAAVAVTVAVAVAASCLRNGNTTRCVLVALPVVWQLNLSCCSSSHRGTCCGICYADLLVVLLTIATTRCVVTPALASMSNHMRLTCRNSFRPQPKPVEHMRRTCRYCFPSHLAVRTSPQRGGLCAAH